MKREEMEKQVDDWLDRAASEYGRADRRPGFETRVAANLNNRLKKRRWCFRWIPAFAFGVTFLAISLCFLVTRFQDRARIEIASKESGSGKPALRHSDVRESPSPLAKMNTRRLSAPKSRIEPTGFLSGELTEQERDLVTFAKAISAQAATGTTETTPFIPLQLPDPDVPVIRISAPVVSTIDIQDFQLTTFNESEEPS